MIQEHVLLAKLRQH